MAYESIFDFLKGDEKLVQVYDMCIAMEKSFISNSYNASLILSRTASELLMKLLIDDSDYRMDFFQKDEHGHDKIRKDGSYIYVSLYEMIEKSKEHGIIGTKIQGRYHSIRKVGNSNTHGEELADYGITDCEETHKNLFLISLHGYNRLNNDNKQIRYENYLGNYDFKIEISPQERENQVGNVRFEEVSKDNLIDSYRAKQLFIPIRSFKSIYEKYDDDILDKEKFIQDLDNFDHVGYDNLDLILNYFDESVTSDIVVDIRQLHDDISSNVFKTLDELNKSNLTFEEINTLIDEASDSNQKEIYSNIKALADDLVKNYLDEYKKEIESSPVTDFGKNGRKLLRYKSYNIVEDRYGFSLKEFDENILFDDDQTKAIEYDGEKPLVINAGPGSGKTRVIIERVAHLVKTKKEADPNFKASSILVITFTRKATQELKERLLNETDLDIKDINQIKISTVHGFCRYLISQYEHKPYNYLNRHGEKSLFFKKYKQYLGFKKYAFLYDHWIPKVLDKYNEYFSFKLSPDSLIGYLEDKMSNYEYNNQKYESYIDDFYENNDEKEYPNIKQLKKEHLSGASYYYRWLNVAKSYEEFLGLMEKASTCDDNTVLSKAGRILEDKEFLNRIRFKHILIDEFQDTDHYQKDIFDKLLKISESFTVVGDVDQSIYGWRGAYPENFENFSRGNVKIITLHNNYRSSRNIVEFNEELIKAKRNLPKELHAKKKYKAPVYQMTNSSVEEEASRIVELIANLKTDGKIKYYSDVAVLFRKNNSVDKLIKPLEENGIEYYLKENNDYLDQNEVKAMLTLLWYVMPFRKCQLNHLGDDFLNLYGFTNERYFSNDVFRLSDDTMELLKDVQSGFEETLKRTARKVNSRFNRGRQITFEYEAVFNLDDHIKKEIFEEINAFDLADLDRNGLIDFGINNESDLDFFLKLRDIKNRLTNNPQSLSTLDLFYELLNVTDYFSEISIESNPNYLKVKDNLALFSHIIKDYESIMGEYDHEGLFIYLSRVLKGYSCRHDEFDEGFNKVHLLSMHSAKGLEYPVVIVGSIKQGICPLNYKNESRSNPDFNLEFADTDYYRSDDLYPTPNNCLEYKEDDLAEDEKKYDLEELRTIYVATTRAKEILVLSTIGDNPNDVPEFLYNLKINPNTNIQELHPYTVINVPKIESSKVFKQENDFPNINFEDILDDYLYCEYRYDLANNTRFKVKLRNDKYVNLVLHKLLNSIHEDENISLGRVDAKINDVLNYHNIKDFHNAYEIINNVRDYWMDFGRHYEIVGSGIKIFSQLQYCDLHSVIDLVIREDGKISLAHFIGSDENIPDVDGYLNFLMYYVSLLKEFDEFKDEEFGKVYLHSLKNNKRYEQEYDEDVEEDVLDELDDITQDIYDNVFVRYTENCKTCEYYGSVCKG